MARECPFSLCDGSGIVIDDVARSSRHCRCREQVVAERQARGLRSVIPKKYRSAGFDQLTHVKPSAVAPVRRFVTRLDEQIAGGRGLWLYGQQGTGKTTLAMLVSKAALAAGHTVGIYSLPRLLAEIRATFQDSSPLTQTELIDQLVTVDLLHIDDVGAEQTSSWVLEQLYAIVNARYEAEKSIIITTNLMTLEEVGEQIGVRTASRLQEMCEVLPVTGPDLRQPRYDGHLDEPADTRRWDVA